jgi:asparagine synthase (glutamine-hydrolysing)
MCGIAGIYSLQPIQAFRGHVEWIVENQHCRGPDFQAVETISGRAAGAVLGHNRLSIIDLSPAGNQPMWDVDRRLCVVFNGEIFNYIELRAELVALGHRFASTSDTEVILEAFKRWGTDAFSRFNGMFAFGLFDTGHDRLYLVRDRFGVKPLYFAVGKDTIHFASTARTIARLLHLAPDLDYLSCGVRYALYEHGDAAPYVGMKALMPGHWMEVSANGSGGLTVATKTYYDLRARIATQVDSLATMPIPRAAEHVSELLNDAVRVRLRADVPVAVSLSGGLDSSTVAALAAGFPHERLQGFTFGHPDVSDSEGSAAAELSKRAGIEVTYIWPDIAQICRAYEGTLHSQAGPFFNGSIIAQYMVFEAAQAAGFKVLLGGQGGDEAFMGYRKFQVFWLGQLMAQKRYLEALGFTLWLLPTFFAERWRWWQSWSMRHRYLAYSGMPTVLDKLSNASMTIGYSPSRPLWERQILDVTLASLPTLLRYEDSNSMGNSVESRLPFMDYRVVECGVALPEALKLRRGYGKWIVRRAMAEKVPKAICEARFKKGFTVQENCWIDSGLGGFIRQLLHDRFDQIQPWLGPRWKIDACFSNKQLILRPCAFVEATTLLWLAEVALCATADGARDNPP